MDDRKGTSLPSDSKPLPVIDVAPAVARTQSEHPGQPKVARQICDRCIFPKRTCVCPSLPSNPLYPLLQKCRILVLQHPHEHRRANSSLPLAELCLFGRRQNKEKDEPSNENKFVMKTIIARRFGDHCDGEAMKVLRDPNQVVVLVFPHTLAMDFEEGLRIAEERCCINLSEENEDVSDGNTVNHGDSKLKKMTLVFIDGTWKHAKEMEAATDAAGEWPESMIRVQLTPSSIGKSRVDFIGTDNESKTQCDNIDSQTFIQSRFLIRTPPSPDHLSTAECIAWIVSRIENNPIIYKSVTNVLDYMVGLWKGCNNDVDVRKQSCKYQMSQKKMKISKC